MTDPLADTSSIPIPITAVPPAKSATVMLVELIELTTRSAWTQEQRAAVAELIRTYRFEQVGGVLLRVQALVRQTGDEDLSNKIHYGQF